MPQYTMSYINFQYFRRILSLLYFYCTFTGMHPNERRPLSPSTEAIVLHVLQPGTDPNEKRHLSLLYTEDPAFSRVPYSSFLENLIFLGIYSF